MKRFEVREFGIDRLAIVDCPESEPGPGQVLVKLRAASLNYRDFMTVVGTYNPKMRRPMVPLSDGAGVVERLGTGVTRFRVGDRVTGCFFQNWTDGPQVKETAKSALGGALDGVLSEYVIFSEDGLVPSPGSLSDEEAACLPCAALTAWHALFEDMPVVPGQSILLQGTGGVSLFALQFAVAAGMRVIVTSSSDAKLTRARSLGAHETINYRTTSDWEEAARRLTSGRGVDQVIEVGGGDTLPRSLRAVRTAGTVSVIGVLTGIESAAIDPRSILSQSLRVQGIYVGSRSMFERMNHFLSLSGLRPIIDRTFSWTDAVAALRHLESQSHFGKICLTF